jgi:superfamily II DNA/RNA helicase
MSEVTFDAFGLNQRIAAAVRAAGYTTPTPIQEQTIPGALKGRHVLGLAQTGTGKTAAFVLPILQRLDTQGATGHTQEHTGDSRNGGPRGSSRPTGRGGRYGRRTVKALVIAPTRELAEQINDEFRRLGTGTHLKSATVYGGVGFQPQVEALGGKADVIVACPGRLLDHIERGNADLSNVEVLVLDEADHMFDMGFLPPVRAILREVPDAAQRLLFSATMPSEIRHLANDLLTDPVEVEISRKAPAETIEHALVPVEEQRKTDLLLHMLKTQDHRSTLVFTRTKHRAKRLAATLDAANIFAAEIQGNLSQRRRQEALDGFKSGKYHVLVATDIAARGIDVARVSHVINYDVPDTTEAYTHRIGRTGRAKNTGEALTFVTPSDFPNVRALERALSMRVTRKPYEGFGAGHTDQLDRLVAGANDRFVSSRVQNRPDGQAGRRGGHGGSRGGSHGGSRGGGQGAGHGGSQGGNRSGGHSGGPGGGHTGQRRRGGPRRRPEASRG